MRGMDETFGMGAGASVRKGKGKKKAAPKKAAKSKADYRPGGMYSTGRAIPPSPGTKKSATPRRSADSYGSPKGAKKKGTNRLVNTLRSVYSANPGNIPVTSRLTQKRK